MSPNGTSIHVPDIHFGWGNKGDVHRVLLYARQKIGTATSSFIIISIFSLVGLRDKQFVFATQAILSLTPPKECWPVRLDVNWHSC